MGRDADVTMYLDHVKVVIDEATEQALAAVAFQIEGEAKVRARVDTGFMRNAVYVVTRDGDDYEQRGMEARAVNPTGEMASRAALADADAAVVAGAEYSIYVEQRYPFLYPAAELVVGQAGGTAERVYQERVKD